jgi:hypothetical protein
MSTLFSPDSVFLQRFLRSGGYYKGNIDGLVRPKTAAALREFEVDTQQIANEIGAFDKRTEAAFGHPASRVKSGFHYAHPLRHTHFCRTSRPFRCTPSKRAVRWHRT